jgi:hypothetical protein
MKKTISHYIDCYLKKHSGDEEKLHDLSQFIEDFFHEMDEDYSDVKSAFYMELDDFTEEIDEEMIREVVENLRQKDGTVNGVKWTIEETDSVAKQYSVPEKIEACGKKFDSFKFWLALNYVHAVHFSLNRTINGYVDLAIDEYCNKNVHFDDLIKRIFEKI